MIYALVAYLMVGSFFSGGSLGRLLSSGGGPNGAREVLMAIGFYGLIIILWPATLLIHLWDGR